MHQTVKYVLIAVGVGIVLLGLGYVWGASGRFTIESALNETRQRLDIAEARGHILDARVSLYNMNFGEANASMEDAKVPLRRIRQRYVEAGRTDSVRNISAAIEHLTEAQRLAGKLDPAANTQAGEALEAIKVATAP
jgi:hypothetical protein